VAETTPEEGRVVTLVVERLAPEPVVRSEGWCTSQEAVLVLPLPDGGEETLSVPVGELVIHLAALVGLGPRPSAASGSAPPATPKLHWRVETHWHGPGGVAAGRAVAALDGGDDGWWLTADDGAASQPTTATDLFRYLCRLLPTDAELG
jgi:hypothetical protein